MQRLKKSSVWGYMSEHWKRLSLFGVGGLLAVVIGLQLGYPWNKLPLGTVIEGKNVGGQQVDDVIKMLDNDLKNQKLQVYFGDSPKAYVTPKPAEIGVTIKSENIVKAAEYPLWLRLIPTSLWWAHAAISQGELEYKYDSKKVDEYVDKKLGGSCDVKPENASLVYKDGGLQIVPVINGGTCKLDDVKKTLMNVKPKLGDSKVKIAMVAHPAPIQNKAAEAARAKFMERSTGVRINTSIGVVLVPQNTLLSWLQFSAPNEGIQATIDGEKAGEFMDKEVQPKVYIKPGTSRVKTLDFQVISQQLGASGRTLDRDATLTALTEYINGRDVDIEALTKTVPANVTYDRQYTKSDEGLKALLQQFAETHPGTYGVKYVELSGAMRHGGYNESRAFVTASTYKLFVAYGTLKRVDAGQFNWSDIISGGQNLATCFDKMIVNSDNPCAEALLYKIGQKALTQDIQNDLGLKNSTFLKDNIYSTAEDEAAFLADLARGQLGSLTQDSQNRLISAMKRNVYRKGVPAGASGPVADKVGFLWGLLHDASIVYSPSGTYVLVILTDGAGDWGQLAELTRQIEAWRAL